MFTTPKAMLQNHDIVVTRCSKSFMYYADKNIFVNSNGYLLEEDYDEDLIMNIGTECEEYDIVEIRRPKSWYQLVEHHWKEAEVIWKRPEDVEMTLEEICEALGKNIKIVKSKK